MRYITSLIFLAIAMVAALDARAQDAPASYASAGAKFTFASRLGYKQPGVGFTGAAGIALPHDLYLTQEFEAIRERKTFLPDGRTIASTTGLEYHLKGGWFARAAFTAASHSNSAYSKTAVRIQIGGGYSFYARGAKPRSDLPILTLGVAAFVPVSDPNGGRGVVVSAENFWAFGRFWGLRSKARGSFASFVNGATRGRANYGDVQFGLFVNLSAIIRS